jgi:hypothetical protein
MRYINFVSTFRKMLSLICVAVENPSRQLIREGPVAEARFSYGPS